MSDRSLSNWHVNGTSDRTPYGEVGLGRKRRPWRPFWGARGTGDYR